MKNNRKLQGMLRDILKDDHRDVYNIAEFFYCIGGVETGSTERRPRKFL
jgi:hypothetical protein